MSLAEEIRSYQDPWGLVSNERYPMPESWDNPLLFTAQYYNLIDQECPAHVFSFAVHCADEGLVRWPGTHRRMSQDEITGLAILAPVIADDVLDKLPIEYERFPYLVPLLRLVTGQAKMVDKITWALELISSARSPRDDTSGKCLFWVQLRAVRRRNYLVCNLAILIWQFWMSRKYPGGLQELFNIYFPGHPLSKYAPTSFDLELHALL